MVHLFVTPFWIVCVYYCMYAIVLVVNSCILSLVVILG